MPSPKEPRAALSERGSNREIPLIPMIDLLLCLVAFLLVTAVWTENARLDADATGGRADRCGSCGQERRLHVELRDDKFRLTWKENSTVISSSDVPRETIANGGEPRYRWLAERVAAEWRASGVHRAASDRHSDRAVLHTGNQTEYAEIVAVLDAIAESKREIHVGGARAEIPVFSVALAID
jgi:biopolymer transport protein ExbD